jgi:hypothetical protein
MDELADTMAPLYSGEALAPLSEVIPTNFINKGQSRLKPTKIVVYGWDHWIDRRFMR